MPSNQRRVAMITGGNSGIGLVTAGKLAGQGFHVILAARNQQTAGQAIERIQAAIPGASVEPIPLDLASYRARAARRPAPGRLGRGLPQFPGDKP